MESRGHIFAKVLRIIASVIASILIAYTGFLLVAFLSMGLGSNGRIDPEGWLMLACFLTITVLGGFSLWRYFKRGSRAGGLPNYIAAGVALAIAVVLFNSERDFVTITIPMLLLAVSLAILPSRRRKVTKAGNG